VIERRPKDIFFDGAETTIERSWLECIGGGGWGAWGGVKRSGEDRMYRVHREFRSSVRSVQSSKVCPKKKKFDRARSFVQIVAMGHYVD
jgi:hypothetical protein